METNYWGNSPTNKPVYAGLWGEPPKKKSITLVELARLRVKREKSQEVPLTIKLKMDALRFKIRQIRGPKISGGCIQ